MSEEKSEIDALEDQLRQAHGEVFKATFVDVGGVKVDVFYRCPTRQESERFKYKAFDDKNPKKQADGADELDYEAEEAAILQAVGSTELDLLVDESGEARALAHHLESAGRPPVLHLSCHGLGAWPGPGGQPPPSRSQWSPG